VKRALITGATGQDGSYLSELLLSKGYEVHLQSRCSGHEYPKGAIWHSIDLADRNAIEEICLSTRPNEIYNLAAISQPQETWESPLETALVNGLVPVHFLEVIRTKLPDCRLYQASSSEMFGNSLISPQNEHTPFQPQTPYAIAKVYAHQMVSAYRLRYGLFACAGILFNHDSPKRPLSFVMQKIAHAAALIASGVRDSEDRDERGQPLVSDGCVSLGNIDVSRDFGYAGDYVNAMWLMLQKDRPDNYVVGSGETHSIRDICKVAFDHVNRDWEEQVIIDPHLVRALDNRYTIADASRARHLLGWAPSVSFEDLVRMMVDARLEVVKERQLSPKAVAS
jgi:GDPmannose 4,6-dehydratase